MDLLFEDVNKAFFADSLACFRSLDGCCFSLTNLTLHIFIKLRKQADKYESTNEREEGNREELNLIIRCRGTRAGTLTVRNFEK